MSKETIADILAEMFDFSDKRIEEGRNHAMTSECVGLIVHQLAKRFEAAWKRESAGNAAAMREALETVRKYAKETTPDRVMLGVIEVWCDEALAAPARNCDKYADKFCEDMLHADFVKYCNDCDCPMGCVHRKDTRCMLDTRCASILKCFSRFVLQKAEAEKGGAE
jgi:hypothetical protein